ncbi:MAG: hypothetical protein SOZ80_07935 [Prevotella sp.]|uniref:hypothetical protein n=1 Tax=Prevotella sp. TaxID=59823 RepID=UPI002A250E50|nr:hypothetical protein [Prevotella sp.]MDD7317772.1 hypothetical protein [Prevotellaceae bacterium]MDY4020687.1 hypothetical protein [Prevotella sp.]
MEQDSQNLIFLIGLYVLMFFIIYSVVAWLGKILIRKLGKKDKQTGVYITAEEYDKEISELEKRIKELEKIISKQADKDCDCAEVAGKRAEKKSVKAVKANQYDQSVGLDRPDRLAEHDRLPQSAQPSPQTYFLPPPSPEGIFHEAFSQPRIGRTVYQMTTIDGNNGTFIFYEDRDALATAIISISQIVKTVCRVENNKNAPRNIINVKEGQVVREGNSWRVAEKATVRFE